MRKSKNLKIQKSKNPEIQKNMQDSVDVKKFRIFGLLDIWILEILTLDFRNFEFEIF